MLNYRCSHATVSMADKLFVIGGNHNNDSEVFDTYTNKFVFIKNTPEINYFVNALSIGYKVYIFQNVKGTNTKENRSDILTLCYDDKLNAWIKESNVYFVGRVVSCAKIFKK